MNEILYKIPPIFTAILGGLWYFAASSLHTDKMVSCVVFLFAAIASICFINVMQRFRFAFNAYIDNLNKMDGDMKVTLNQSDLPSTITIVQLLLWTAAIVSFLGAIYATRM